MAGWDDALAQTENWRNYVNSRSSNFGNNFGAAIPAPSAFSGPAASGLYGLMPNTGYYNDQGQANAVLQRILQFDPNASVATINDQGGGEGVRYGLNFDQSKLPQMAPGFTTVQPRSMGYFNRNMVVNDPNYGAVTPIQNQYAPSQTSWLDIVGPMLVGGFAGLGAGGFSALSSLFSKLPNVASTLGGAGNPILSGSGGMTPQQMLIYRLLASRGS